MSFPNLMLQRRERSCMNETVTACQEVHIGLNNNNTRMLNVREQVYISLLLPQLPKVPDQWYSNRAGNLDNLGSKKRNSTAVLSFAWKHLLSVCWSMQPAGTRKNAVARKFSSNILLTMVCSHSVPCRIVCVICKLSSMNDIDVSRFTQIHEQIAWKQLYCNFLPLCS